MERIPTRDICQLARHAKRHVVANEKPLNVRATRMVCMLHTVFFLFDALETERELSLPTRCVESGIWIDRFFLLI